MTISSRSAKLSLKSSFLPSPNARPGTRALIPGFRITGRRLRFTSQPSRDAPPASRIALQQSSFTIRRSRIAIRQSHFTIQRSRIAVRESRIAVRQSRIAVRESRIAIRQSHFTIRQSRIAVRRSRITVRQCRIAIRWSRIAIRKTHSGVRLCRNVHLSDCGTGSRSPPAFCQRSPACFPPPRSLYASSARASEAGHGQNPWWTPAAWSILIKKAAVS
jgi:hypothetical protein